jgi:hypothetical protein
MSIVSMRWLTLLPDVDWLRSLMYISNTDPKKALLSPWK